MRALTICKMMAGVAIVFSVFILYAKPTATIFDDISQYIGSIPNLRKDNRQLYIATTQRPEKNGKRLHRARGNIPKAAPLYQNLAKHSTNMASRSHGNVSVPAKAENDHELYGASVTLLQPSSQLTKTEMESVLYHVDLKFIFGNATQGGPMDYLPDYRSPCWKHGSSRDAKCETSCLPLVYLAGVSKSGTTDLYENLLKHIHIVKPSGKHPKWWNHGRFTAPKMTSEFESFEHYIKRFRGASCEIEKNADPSTHHHPMITIDASTDYLYDYDRWKIIPGNAGLLEPKYILPISLHALVPQPKILVILRQPSKRVYSHFRMVRALYSPRAFHNISMNAITNFKQCRETSSIRQCAYNLTWEPADLRKFKLYTASMYSVFLHDWFAIFPREQFLILKAEEYYANRTKILSEVYNFLNLDIPSGEEWIRLGMKPAVNSNVKRPKWVQDPMLIETKRMLDTFYAPFNEQLAKLLRDDRFKWS